MTAAERPMLDADTEAFEALAAACERLVAVAPASKLGADPAWDRYAAAPAGERVDVPDPAAQAPSHSPERRFDNRPPSGQLS